MKKHLLCLLLLFYPLTILCTEDDYFFQRAVRQCGSGNPAAIEKFGLEQSRKILDATPWDESTLPLLLQKNSLRLSAALYSYFSALKKSGAITLNELKDKEFTCWLLERPFVLEKMAFSRRIDKNTLSVFYQIWSDEKRNLSGPLLNLAMGAAIAAPLLPPKELNEKYLFYKKSFLEKKLLPQFDIQEPWEMFYLFSSVNSSEELKWGQEYLEDKKMDAQNAANVACAQIPYRPVNRNGVSVHQGGAFYDNKPVTLPVYVEYGGVCGAVSHGASRLLQTRGVASYTIGQPGHCAFLWKGADGLWKIGNDIYGWNWSSGKCSSPWDAPVSLMRALSKSQKAPPSADYCYRLSQITAKKTTALLLLEHCLQQNPSHVPAWRNYASLSLTETGRQEETLALLNKVSSYLPEDAQILKFMRNQGKNSMLKKNDPYAFCALLITRDESGDSFENYMNEYWPLVLKELPALGKAPAYNEKNRRVFFKKWQEYFQTEKSSQKLAPKMSRIMEKTIFSILSHEKSCEKFLDQYKILLLLWNNSSLYISSDKFLETLLKKTQDPGLRKKILSMGIELQTAAKNRTRLRFYSDLLQQEKSDR